MKSKLFYILCIFTVVMVLAMSIVILVKLDSLSDEIAQINKTTFFYSINEDGKTCTITGMTSNLKSEIVIPSQIDNYTVTGFDYFAFVGQTELETLTFPDSITRIPDGLSHCDNLRSVIIPNSVTTISLQSFKYCAKLRHITFKGTVAEWNDVAKDSNGNNNTGSYTIYCTDGQITSDGRITYN